MGRQAKPWSSPSPTVVSTARLSVRPSSRRGLADIFGTWERIFYGGFVAHLFPTGQGNIVGNPIEQVIKLTANPRTAGDMSEHIDYDCSALLRWEMTLDQSGDNIIDMLIRTRNGRLTAQEVLGHEEFVLTKLYESA